jgi:hypothetical protein
VAAALPLFLMVPVIVVTAIALAKQSNLWPIILIFAAALAASSRTRAACFRPKYPREPPAFFIRRSLN